MEFELIKKFKNRLSFIYKNENIDELASHIASLVLNNYSGNSSSEKWTEQDAILITYGDSIVGGNEAPLQNLKTFGDTYLKDAITCIHILPFFPFSSDDGFSVIDYMKVNPELGDWNNVENLNKSFTLMFDLVINHISQHSEWFQNFLKGSDPGKDFFHVCDPNKDYSMVTRPRSLPLLSEYETSEGKKHVWTTFSADQIDLNFENPQVLLEMLKVLIYYMKMGARIIRLDAIAFLWKQLGTTCLHLPETHEAVKLMRDVMEAISPNSILLTETNVPNKENLSYFGNEDEAHMVYQFSLPPLLLHALHTGNSTFLNNWASSLPELPDTCTYFNFTASHDGIGVRPLEGLLPNDEFVELTENMKKFGGHISTKRNSDGSDSPYEMNITYFDACKGTNKGEDKLQKERFICSQTIMMEMAGIPAFYIHSITATPNYYDGVKETGRARTINRMKWNREELENLLSSDSTTSAVYCKLIERLKIRKQNKCFHPKATQEIIEITNDLFAVKRSYEDDSILCISNISITPQKVSLASLGKNNTTDLLSNSKCNDVITLQPYDTVWLK